MDDYDLVFHMYSPQAISSLGPQLGQYFLNPERNTLGRELESCLLKEKKIYIFTAGLEFEQYR